MSAGMFALKVAKTQAKPTEGWTSTLVSQRSRFGGRPLPVEQPLLLDHEQAVASEKMVSQEATAGVSWDFSRIPVYTPGPRGMFAEPRSAPSQLPLFVHRKLEIGVVGDPFELEADRVMRIAEPRISVSTARPLVHRKCGECAKEDEDEKKFRLKPAAGSGEHAGEAHGIVNNVLRLPGQPLDGRTRAYFEPRFRHALANVRVHTDARAAASARRLVHSLTPMVPTLRSRLGGMNPGQSPGDACSRTS